MATTAQVIKAILQNILVQGSEAALEPDEQQDTIFAMNNYMLDLDASGIKLGYTEVTNLADVITIPTGALRGLIYNVAIDMAPQYDFVVTAAIADIAKNSLATMRKLGVIMGESALPSTLPRGSGNEGCGDWTSHYYPDEEAAILAETSGIIGLETGTAGAV